MITAVIPIHNVEAQLPELIARLRAIPDLRCLFVEDCGDDRCRDILRSQADETVGALFLKKNFGQNRAILEGIKWSPLEPVVVLDGDLQDRPEAIPLLRDHLFDCDVVFAQRLGTYQSWKESLTSFFFKGAFRIASRFRLPPKVGTFFLMGPEAVRYFQKLQSSDPYMIGLIALSGLKISAVEVAREVRPGGGSSYNFRSRLHLAFRAFRSCGLLPIPSKSAFVRVELAERVGWVS